MKLERAWFGAAVVATLALGCVEQAHGTILQFLASANGGPAGRVIDARPGDVVTIELRAFAPSSLDTIGLAGLTFRPSATQFVDRQLAPSSLVGWTTPSQRTDQGGPGVSPTDGLGRIQPFGAPAVAENPDVSSAPGGFSLGGTGTQGGLAVSQTPISLSINSFGSYYNASRSPLILRFAFRIPQDISEMENFDVGMGVEDIEDQPAWYNASSPSSATTSPVIDGSILGARICVAPVPAPASASLLLVLGALGARRRR